MTGTRQQLMQALLHHKEAGLTIEELSGTLEISRNAVQQHLTSLECDGLVGALTQRYTGGRPSRAYTLSEKGYELFPRNYAMLARRCSKRRAQLSERKRSKSCSCEWRMNSPKI